jgi:hypothetical protein
MTAAATLPPRPSFNDKVAATTAIDTVELASRITALGVRGAMSASTVGIVAMAHRLLALETLASLTYELLNPRAEDQSDAPIDAAAMAALRAVTIQQIGDVGAQLETLGYAADSPTTTEAQKET